MTRYRYEKQTIHPNGAIEMKCIKSSYRAYRTHKWRNGSKGKGFYFCNCGCNAGIENNGDVLMYGFEEICPIIGKYLTCG